MANTVSKVDFSTESLTVFLAKAVTGGTINDVLTTLKFDKTGEIASATDIAAASGELWSNIVDDIIKAIYPAHYKGQKIWSVADEATRDALGSDDDLLVDDVAWVISLKQFWFVVSVDGAASSTWAQATGAAGSGAGIRYEFDAGTADADPGPGKFRFDNASQAAATFMFVNNDTVDGTGLNQIIFEYGADHYTFLQQEASPTSNKTFRLTGGIISGGGYFKIPVVIGSATQGTDITVGQNITFEFLGGGGLNRILSRGTTTTGFNIDVSPGDKITGQPVPIESSDPDTAPVMTLTATGTNGAATRMFVGTRDPNGFVTGNPGDMYRRSDAASSTVYQHRGAATSNDDWQDLGLGGSSAIGGEWRFNNTISGDPGNGRWRFDNATQTSSTIIAISKTTDENVDASNILLNLIGIAFNIYAQQQDTAGNFHTLDITGAPVDQTTYVEYAISFLNSGADIVNNRSCILSFFSQAGSAALSQILSIGNTTGGNDIAFSNSGADVLLADSGFPLIIRSTSTDSIPVSAYDVTGANGAKAEFHSGNRDPTGVVTGNPGAFYMRTDTTNSRIYQHRGLVANNTDWVEITAGIAAANLPSICVSRTTDLRVPTTPGGLAFDTEIGPAHDTGEYTYSSGDNDITVVNKANYLIQSEISMFTTIANDSPGSSIMELYVGGAVLTDPVISFGSADNEGFSDATSITISVVLQINASTAVGPRMYPRAGERPTMQKDTMRLSLIKISQTLV